MNEEHSINTDLETMPSSNSDKQNKSMEGLYEWIEAAIFSLTFVVLVFSFLFRIVGVDGDSMNPSLINKERLIITNLMYTPERGDIVIINRYDKEPLVKRVIAVGGDKLEINEETNEVIVNDIVQSEPFIQGKTEAIGFQPTSQVVPDGCVFVMGDNRENSRDSRWMSEIGFVKRTDIMGKAIFRFLPLSRAGGLYENAAN